MGEKLLEFLGKTTFFYSPISFVFFSIKSAQRLWQGIVYFCYLLVCFDAFLVPFFKYLDNIPRCLRTL